MRYTAILKSDSVQIILTQICMQTQKVLFFIVVYTHMRACACLRTIYSQAGRPGNGWVFAHSHPEILQEPTIFKDIYVIAQKKPL